MFKLPLWYSGFSLAAVEYHYLSSNSRTRATSEAGLHSIVEFYRLMIRMSISSVFLLLFCFLARLLAICLLYKCRYPLRS